MMYSFGSGKKGTQIKNQTPGPGAYESTEKNSIYKTSQKCKIGTADRMTLKKSDGPGPGTYDSYSKGGIQYSFGSKLGKISNKNQTPGPGVYEGTYSAKQSAPSYTLGGKKYQKNDNYLPGPGEYEYKSTVTGVPTAKLGTSKRECFKVKETPGPGSYGESYRPFSANAPGCRFGTQNRINDFKNEKYKQNYQPGPGEYEHRSAFDATKGVSMGIRKGDLIDKEKSKVPGPGAYDAKKMIPNKQVRIGTSTRETIKDNQVPGPGSYEKGFVDKKRTPGFSMGTSTRRPLSAAQDNPGPGNYNYQEKIIEGPAFIFGSKPQEESKETPEQFMPGPGEYLPDYNITQKKQATFAFGRDERDKQIKQEIPGPGQYDTRPAKIGGPSFGFGSGPREVKVKNDAPGPGAYTQESAIGKVPKYLLPNGSKAK